MQKRDENLNINKNKKQIFKKKQDIKKSLSINTNLKSYGGFTQEKKKFKKEN